MDELIIVRKVAWSDVRCVRTYKYANLAQDGVINVLVYKIVIKNIKAFYESKSDFGPDIIFINISVYLFKWI